MFFQKVTNRLIQGALVTFFLLLVSNEWALAHSSDFVFARWSQDKMDGSVELSLSIQISDNPNIESREQAVEVLTSLMQVRSGAEGEFVPVGDVAVARFKEDISFPQDSPVPIGGVGLEELESGAVVDEGGGKKHEILTLEWKWKPSPNEEQLSFFLPDDCEQNVVFWWADVQVEGPPPGKEIPWQILLGGDESFPVALRANKNEEIASDETVKITWRQFIVLGEGLVIVLAGAYLIVGRGRAK